MREKIKQARRLRAEPTIAEALLWPRLRRRALNGWKFRRQADVGRWIADFLCHDPRLIIEIDGPVHALFRAEKDEARDKYLKGIGFIVLRLPERLIRDDIEEALKRIVAAGASTQNTQAPSPAPPPLVQGRGAQTVLDTPETAFSPNQVRNLRRFERRRLRWAREQRP